MRLAFGCPYYGPTPPRVVMSQLAAVMHVAWQHPWVAQAGTERTGHVVACERILQRAVESKADALFWTEHDCVLPLDAVTRLVKVLEAHPEADAVTGITFMRYKPYHPMIADWAGILTQELLDSEPNVMVTNVHNGEPVLGKEHFKFVTRIDTGAAPFKVDATSLNCVLFRRSAMEVMASIEHPFDVGHFTTPDFALFSRLRGRITMLCDPSLLTLHLGEQQAIGFDTWVREMEAMVKTGDAEFLPLDEERAS